MRALMMLAILTLAACGSAQQPAEEKPMPVSETVIAPYVSDMDKARAVQDTLQKDADKTDATLKAAE